MKRTAKNEQTNDQNATKNRRDRDVVEKKAARSVDFSQALRRSTAALALTCGVCVGVSGCQSFLGSADERFRQGRGEYALNDEAVARDWEEAAREMGKTTQNGAVGENGRNSETGQNAGKDPASSRPVLRSAAFDEASEDASRRVVLRKPVAEPEAPKSFGERVKGLFSRPKKESGRSANSKNAEAFAASGNSAYLGKSGNFIRSDEAKKAARSTESGFSLGRGLPNVFSPSKRRDREKFPVDPVLQYDESRFMPSFQTCEQYYAPIEPRQPAERPLTSAEALKSGKGAQAANFAQNARAGAAVATKTTQKRRNAPTRVSGRELVANSEKRQATLEDGAAWATGGASSKASATGWGKTRPIAVASSEERATAKGPVAPVGYVNAAPKKEVNFGALTERCDGFFGWEAGDEARLNAISEPTEEINENLTAYSTAPSPTAPAFPAVDVSAFATEVAEIATGNEQNALVGQDAATLTASAPTQETVAPLQNVSPESTASLASDEPSAGIDEVAEVAQIGESAPNSTVAPVLKAYSPSATRKNAGESSDFASQLGETGFDWFESQTRNAAAQPAVEAATVATLGPEIAPNIPVETPEKLESETLDLVAGTPRVDLDAALAERLAPVAETGELSSGLPVAEVGELSSGLPVAEVGELSSDLPVAEVGELSSSLPVAEVGELSSGLPVAEVGELSSGLPIAEVDELTSEAPVAETGELSSGLPVAEVGELTSEAPVAPLPIGESLTPVAAETLDVEAPRALAAVEENGVAGPNFALAAPGLGAGEAIQNAADERKDAAVAKPLSGDEIAWVEQIKSAIRTLVAERDAKKAAGEDVRRLDARLRLLYLAVDEYDRSIQEIQDDADPLKVFWETERGDLEALLQSRLEEIDPTFVAERLRAGLDSLSGLCDLQIRKSALVVAPACFGLYEERSDAYRPGEPVFAYAELEYVSCRETEDGRLIDVECRWRLLNADGSELTPVETQRCSNLSETKLRDVVLNVSAPLPNDLPPGTYLLETEVVDMNRPDAKPATKRLELIVGVEDNAEKAAE